MVSVSYSTTFSHNWKASYPNLRKPLKHCMLYYLIPLPHGPFHVTGWFQHMGLFFISTRVRFQLCSLFSCIFLNFHRASYSRIFSYGMFYTHYDKNQVLEIFWIRNQKWCNHSAGIIFYSFIIMYLSDYFSSVLPLIVIMYIGCVLTKGTSMCAWFEEKRELMFMTFLRRRTKSHGKMKWRL